jgi:GxxExxY protein
MENQSAVTGRVIGCSITVHRILGPRLRENAYEEALAIEFLEQGVAFERQVSVPIQYKGHWIGHYQIDFIVEREVVVEVKSINEYHPIFEAQMLAYLRATGLHLGLLVNFNTHRLSEGVRRFIM